MFFLSVRAKGSSEMRKEVVGGTGVVEVKLWAVCRTPVPDFQLSQAGGLQMSLLKSSGEQHVSHLLCRSCAGFMCQS